MKANQRKKKRTIRFSTYTHRHNSNSNSNTTHTFGSSTQETQERSNTAGPKRTAEQEPILLLVQPRWLCLGFSVRPIALVVVSGFIGDRKDENWLKYGSVSSLSQLSSARCHRRIGTSPTKRKFIMSSWGISSFFFKRFRNIRKHNCNLFSLLFFIYFMSSRRNKVFRMRSSGLRF